MRPDGDSKRYSTGPTVRRHPSPTQMGPNRCPPQGEQAAHRPRLLAQKLWRTTRFIYPRDPPAPLTPTPLRHQPVLRQSSTAPNAPYESGLTSLSNMQMQVSTRASPYLFLRDVLQRRRSPRNTVRDSFGTPPHTSHSAVHRRWKSY